MTTLSDAETEGTAASVLKYLTGVHKFIQAWFARGMKIALLYCTFEVYETLKTIIVNHD